MCDPGAGPNAYHAKPAARGGGVLVTPWRECGVRLCGREFDFATSSTDG